MSIVIGKTPQLGRFNLNFRLLAAKTGRLPSGAATLPASQARPAFTCDETMADGQGEAVGPLAIWRYIKS